MGSGCSLRRLTALAAVLTTTAACLYAGEAHAQQVQTTEVDLPRFNPPPPGDRFFSVPSPFAAGSLTPHVGLILDYARDPLVLVRDTGDTTEDVGAVVSDQLFLHVAFNVSFANYVALSADMPFAVYNAGDAPDGGALSFEEPNAAAVGDLRLGLRVRLIGNYHDSFQLGAGGYVWVPTHYNDSYISDGTVRGQPQLLLGGRNDWFIWSLFFGATFRSPTNLGPVTIGHSANWGGGVGFLLLDNKALQVGLETTGGVDVQTPDARTLNAELLAGLKYRLPVIDDALELGIAGGPGLTTGIGTPAGRFVFSFSYTPVIPPPATAPPPIPDTDGDGIFDDKDACPTVPGVPDPDPTKNGCPPPEKDRDRDGILDKEDACPDEPGKPHPEDRSKNGCPDRDRDKDTIIDEVDACPDEPGIPSDDPKKNGCPPPKDKDGDGIIDDVDACIDIPGVASSDPKQNGCPPDTDGDGFRDDLDACPKEKGVDDSDPSKRGCPKLVRFTEKEIVILEQIQFDFGKATIRKVSDPLLDSIAQVLKEHPEVLKLEIQGHTDNKGSKTLNQKLSQDRANAVRDALIKRGIDGNRLTAKGYGMDVPIADNKTDEGRAKNRRVQFVITDKKAAEPTK
ncbi:MAG: OmpA family protein [Polyangiaceae bacterium]